MKKSEKTKEGPESNEIKELEEDFIENYYRDWCYQKIPLLDNKTPKQAMKTKQGKEALKELLVTFGNHEKHTRQNKDNFAENIIRDELNFYEK